MALLGSSGGGKRPQPHGVIMSFGGVMRPFRGVKDTFGDLKMPLENGWARFQVVQPSCIHLSPGLVSVTVAYTDRREGPQSHPPSPQTLASEMFTGNTTSIADYHCIGEHYYRKV